MTEPNPVLLTHEEEKQWKKLKQERNTVEDWSDLHRTLIAYRRRYIERHEQPHRSRTEAGIDARASP